MAPSKKNRSTFWRIAGATCIAAVLWSVTSLSDTFVWTLKVPLTVELRPDQALVEPVPKTLDVTVQATGWSLVSQLIAGGIVCQIDPPMVRGPNEYLERYSSRELLENTRTISGTSLLRVNPDSLLLRIGPVSSRKVPLVSAVRLTPRKGFQVVGRVRLEPDSVLLTGSSRALQSVTSWPTVPITLDDIHGPINGQTIRISDSLRGVLVPTITSTRLVADVQEVAERTFPDVPVINRGTIRDTAIHLVLQPQRVEVLVRGGARDLSQLDPQSLVAYINVIEGTDTLGIASPRLMPLAGFTIVSVKPKQIRYFWKRVVE